MTIEKTVTIKSNVRITLHGKTVFEDEKIEVEKIKELLDKANDIPDLNTPEGE